jgi:AcrR family transcriptional regulator
MSPVGRPRAAPRLSSGDPREEILRAAADLFGTSGYTATSTRAIAQAVGLRQASLFHYYARKELILVELLDRTLRPTLDLTTRLGQANLGPEAALWVVAKCDVSNLCAGPHNLGALQLLPEVRAPQFGWFWRRRESLFDFYRLQVAEGVEAGVISVDALPLGSDLVFGLVESVITATESVRADPLVSTTIADGSLYLLGVPTPRVRKAQRAGIQFLKDDPVGQAVPIEPLGQPVGGAGSS